jgi:anti-sigma B factor antagonist
MFIRTWSFDDVAVLDVSGRLGVEAGRAFGATVSNVLLDGRRQLVVNLLGVSAMDASGLGALVDALKQARAVGGDIKLVVRSPIIRDLLNRTQLVGLFATFSSEAEALASFDVQVIT